MSTETAPAPVSVNTAVFSDKYVRVVARQFNHHSECHALGLARLNAYNWEAFPNESDANCALMGFDHVRHNFYGELVFFGDWLVSFALHDGTRLQRIKMSNADFALFSEWKAQYAA